MCNYNTNIGVYKITNIVNGDYYIGSSSVSLTGRMSRHRLDLINSRHPNPKLQRSWNVYGESSFSFDVVYYCTIEEDPLDVEQDFLDYGFSKHPRKLFNVALNSKAPMLGLVGPNNGRKFSPETRKKMSEYRTGRTSPNKGNKLSPETKSKMSKARKGLLSGAKNPNAILTWDIVREIRDDYSKGKYSQTELSKKYNISRTNTTNIINNKRWYCSEYEKTKPKECFTFPVSNETRAKLSKAGKGRNHTKESLLKMSNNQPNKVSVVQLDKDLTVIKTYPSASSVYRELGLDTSGIIKCCKGKNKTCGGYKWMYLEEYEKMKVLQ